MVACPLIQTVTHHVWSMTLLAVDTVGLDVIMVIYKATDKMGWGMREVLG